MDQQDYDYFSGSQGAGKKPDAPREKSGISLGILLSVVCVVAAAAIILTFTLTSAFQRSYYTKRLQQQQEVIDMMRESEGTFDKLEFLSQLFQYYSYYAGDKTEEEMVTAVLKAYAAATGDLYADYYTEEEYAEMTRENNGQYQGIGVSVVQTTATVNAVTYQVFEIISVYEDGPAAETDLRVGDMIYCVKVDGEFQSIAQLGGYTPALNCVRGEEGTVAEFGVLRLVGEEYQTLTFAVTRHAFVAKSVTYKLCKTDPTIGVVSISSFDLTTPVQFKAAVNALLDDGVEHFVFDVRNNPGGDLQSIKAVLTYFLQRNDVILQAIDREGRVAESYVAEPIRWGDQYSACNVSASEIGMYADLDMVVLCNGNTASAAEVFTATLRDYGLAKIVGEKTFGKGIMQSILSLSRINPAFSGYVKMTTYAYVTKCGVTYHEVGISPDEGLEVSLSPEAQSVNLFVLEQSQDAQLQLAFAQFQH